MYLMLIGVSCRLAYTYLIKITFQISHLTFTVCIYIYAQCQSHGFLIPSWLHELIKCIFWVHYKSVKWINCECKMHLALAYHWRCSLCTTCEPNSWLVHKCKCMTHDLAAYVVNGGSASDCSGCRWVSVSILVSIWKLASEILAKTQFRPQIEFQRVRRTSAVWVGSRKRLVSHSKSCQS